MKRAAELGYPTTDLLAAAAGLSNRTVWALVTGERRTFEATTYARLDERLLLEPGSVETALARRGGTALRVLAQGSAQAEARRREVSRMLAQAHIPRDPRRLRSAANRLRAAAPPRDPEMADVAALADMVAAYLDGEEYVRDAFGERLKARTALTKRDRDVIGARGRHRAQAAEESQPGGIPPVIFQQAEAR